MSISIQVKQIFADFGRRYDITAKEETYENGDFCFFYGQQCGLQEKVWMCFDNIDEISFGVGKFFGSSVFPCPDALRDFEEKVDGIISGRNRIRYGWFKSVLEKPDGKKWKIVAKYYGSAWNGVRFRIFTNSPD